MVLLPDHVAGVQTPCLSLSENTKTANSLVLSPLLQFLRFPWSTVFTSCFPPALLWGLRPSQASGANKWTHPFSALQCLQVRLDPNSSLVKTLLVNAGHVVVLFVSVYTSHWEVSLLTLYWCLCYQQNGHSPHCNWSLYPGVKGNNTYGMSPSQTCYRDIVGVKETWQTTRTVQGPHRSF